jgi:hypothetical protein
VLAAPERDSKTVDLALSAEQSHQAFPALIFLNRDRFILERGIYVTGFRAVRC